MGSVCVGAWGADGNRRRITMKIKGIIIPLIILYVSITSAVNLLYDSVANLSSLSLSGYGWSFICCSII